MELKVLSWNIWVDCHFAELKSFIAQADADIIGMQEVREGDPTRDTVGLMSLYGYKHLYAPKQLWTRGREFRYGPAIFSRYDIAYGAFHKLSEERPRYAVQADIRLGADVLHVFNTHLIHTHQEPSELQDAQATALLGLLPGKQTLVMGDFNATPDSKPVKIMEEKLVNTDSENSPTWMVHPEGCDVCKLPSLQLRYDYIFASHDLRTFDPQVGLSNASDHLPISVMVEI